MAYFAPYIDGTGIHLPTYEDRLQDLCSAYRTIFGQEAELTPEVPDYQLLSVIARSLDDTSALVLAGYNSRNPAYATGQALDLLLPQYGLTRQPGETDASARSRAKQALAGGSVFTLDALEAAIRQVPDVTHVLIRENGEDATVDSIPPHSLAVVVNNGIASAIANAIFRKKPPGIGTWGTTTKTVDDGRGGTTSISFSRATLLMVQIHVTVRAYDGFDEDAVRTAMASRLMTYLDRELDIGESLNVPQLYGLLYQAVGSYAPTFAITDLYVSGSHGISREKLVPAWNAKYHMNNTASLHLTIAE